jgi:xylan 1,4-beta-xylosidase
LLAQMEWTSDGWLKYASKSVSVRTETPVAISDDFSGKQLGMHWQFWDAYEPERVTLANASLTLKGKGKAAGESSPLCVMARQSRYEVTVDVEIDGNTQAGLLLFYNAKQYVGVAIDGKNVLAGERGELRVLREPAERRMRLKIVNDFNDVTFFVNGKKVYNGIYVGGYSTHTFGGFLALRPAIYCSGEGRAIFRAFKVAPLK